MTWTWQQFWQDFPPPIVGGALSGICTLLAALFINAYLNRNIKSKEFVFQFTQRYHDILGTKHRLNYPAQGERPVTADDARELYRRLFGLMYDEWYAYQHGFLDPGIFTEWMKWRRDDYRGGAGYNFSVAGKSYAHAWDHWGKIGPLSQSDFSRFLDAIHNCNTYDEVAGVVKEHAPGFLGTAITGQTVLRRTIFLSRLIGISAVAVAVSMILDRNSMISIESTIVQNGALLRAVGMVFVIAGLAIVLGHNVWRGGLLAIVVTILGWLTLLRGLFALWAPSELVTRLIEDLHYAEWFYGYAGLVLVIGGLLAVSSFLLSPAAPSSNGLGVAGAMGTTPQTPPAAPTAAVPEATTPGAVPEATIPGTAPPETTTPDAAPEATTAAPGTAAPAGSIPRTVGGADGATADPPEDAANARR
jgi:hypothetical protein